MSSQTRLEKELDQFLAPESTRRDCRNLMERVRQRAIQRARGRVNSWPYPQVWRALNARTWQFFLLGVMAVGTVGMLAAVNPRFVLNWGWNEIDAVDDPSGRLADRPARAMASSESFIAVVHDEPEITFVNTDSRVPRRLQLEAPPLDITGAARSGEFLMLQNNTSLRWVGRNMLNMFTTSPWIPDPENPIVPLGADVTLPGPGDIVFADVDDDGWLFGIRNVGVVLYHVKRLNDRQRYRSRSFTIADIHPSDVENVRVTRSHLWLLPHPDAPLSGAVRGFARDTLQEIPDAGLSLATGLKSFDYTYDDHWATAVTLDGTLHVYDGTQWNGPYLGPPVGGGTDVTSFESVDDVRIVRNFGDSVVLTTAARGFWWYDRAARRLVRGLPTASVTDILTLAPRASDASDTTDRATRGISVPEALVVTTSGISLIRKSRAEGDTPNSPASVINNQTVFSGEVANAALDPSQMLLSFQVDSRNGRAVMATGSRRWADSEGNVLSVWPSPQTVIPEEALTPRDRPQITAVYSYGDQRLFTTATGGAFLYNPATHTYTDCSQLLATKKDDESDATPQSAVSFRNVSEGRGERLLAIADGYPVSLPLPGGEFRQTGWDLITDGNVTPDFITDTPVGLYGQSKPGVLYRFSGSGNLADTYCRDGMESADGPEDTSPGDLWAIDSDHWATAFAVKDKLYTYESWSGSFRSSSSLPVSQIRQLRIPGPRVPGGQPDVRHCLAVSEGRVYRGKSAVFGAGTIPWNPQHSVCVTGSLDGNTVTFASADGRIGGYDWERGKLTTPWDRVPSADAESNQVTRLCLHNGGLLASLKDGTHWRQAEFTRSWTRWRGVKSWCPVNGSRLEAWACFDDGLKKVTISPSSRDDDQTHHHWSAGNGMKSFLAQAVWAWHPSTDDGRYVFVLNRSRDVGRYDTQTESWQEFPHEDVTGDDDRAVVLKWDQFHDVDRDRLLWREQVVVTSRALFRSRSRELDRVRELQLTDGIPKLVTVLTLPEGATSVSLATDDRQFKCASILGQRLELRTLDLRAKAGSPQVTTRGGDQSDALNPDDVVAAVSGGSSRVILADSQGNIASYDYLAGVWKSLRSGKRSERLASLYRSPTSNFMALWISDDAGDLHLVKVHSGSVTEKELTGHSSTDDVLERVEQLQDEAHAGGERRSSVLHGQFKALERVLRQSAERARRLLRSPRDGELYQSESEGVSLTVRRTDGVAKFTIKAGTKSTALTSAGDILGFAEDRYRSATFEGGRLFALHRADPELINSVELHQDDQSPCLLPGLGSIDQFDVPAVSDGQFERKAVLPQHLARCDYDGRQLVWRLEGEHLIKLEWEGFDDAVKPPEIWDDLTEGSSRLAWQTIDGIAQAANGDLLVLTPSGLFVRDSQTFELLKWLPQETGLAFVHIRNSDPYFIHNGRFTGRWNSKTRRVETTGYGSVQEHFSTGPWHWTRMVQPDGMGTVTIAQASRTDTAMPGSQKVPRSVVHLTAMPGPDLPVRSENTAGWKFADDYVQWIGRNSADRYLWLATRNGAWPFLSDIATRRQESAQPGRLIGRSLREIRCGIIETDGRLDEVWQWREGGAAVLDEQSSDEMNSGSVPDEPTGRWYRVNWSEPNAVIAEYTGVVGPETVLEHPAVRIEASQGTLEISAFDAVGQPDASAFANQRYFFDNGSWLTSYKGSLYSLVEGRCLVKRACLTEPDRSERPTRILGCWSLPKDLRERSDLELLVTQYRGSDRLLLLEPSTEPGQPAILWSISEDGTFGRLEGEDRELTVECGPVTWKRTADGSSTWEPFLYGLGQDSTKAIVRRSDQTSNARPLDNWWSRDRFAWDRVHDVVPFGPDRVFLATDLGPVLLKLRFSTTAATSEFVIGWNQADLTRCYQSRRSGDGKVTGVVFESSDDRKMVVKTGNDTPLLTTAPVGTSEDEYAPHLTVALPARGRLEFSESWKTRSGVPADDSVLTSAIPAVSNSGLVRNGRFIFDDVDLSAPRSPEGKSYCTLMHSDRAPDSWLVTNVINGQGRLVLQQVFRSKRSPIAIRASGRRPGTLVFAFEDRPAGSVSLSEVAFHGHLARCSRAEPVAGSEHAALFRTGSRVKLDTRFLRTTQTADYSRTTGGPSAFAVTPPLDRLFVISRSPVQRGFAFAFDVLNGLTRWDEPSTGNVFLLASTPAGILKMPLHKSEDGRSSWADTELFRMRGGDVPSRIRAMPLETVRIRSDSGSLLGFYRLDGNEFRLSPDMSERYSVGALILSFDKEGHFFVNGNRTETSTDAWYNGKTITDKDTRVIDVGSLSDGSLWMCTSDGRVFKVSNW